MKRFTFIFALLLATTTMMAEEFRIGGLTFTTISDHEVELVGATNGITNIYLTSPITYQGKSYSVTSIGDLAFNGCIPLTSITIPNSVTSIGDNAFGGCNFLTSITIPESVESIGEGAFIGCSSLTSITIPNSVKSIGPSAFYECSSLTSITIPNGVTSIGFAAFKDCSSLTSITIPNSVTSIGDYAFYRCYSLNSISIPNSVTSIGMEAFDGCSSLTSITIPNSVTSIGPAAFVCSSLKSIIVQNGNPIYDNRENCNAIIETATNTLIAGCQNTIIPNSVTSIADAAFTSCSNLRSITIPNSVTSIGWFAFLGCYSLTSITIPESVTSIGSWAFTYCSNLRSITIPNSVTSIGDQAFYGCSALTSITIPNSVTEIGGAVFYGCENLTSVVLSKNMTSLPSYKGTGGTSGFFEKCSSLTSITIPESVEYIGDNAFAWCSSLTSITIPSNTKLGAGAFPEYTKVIREAPKFTIGKLTYEITSDKEVKLVKADESIANAHLSTTITYQGKTYSVTSIGDKAFRGCESLTSVTWNVKSCNDFSYHTYFYGPFYEIRSQITSFTFGDSVQHIPRRLCSEMTKLTSINIPNSVTSIGQGAFFECSSLTSINIPNSVTSIGEGAFLRTALYKNKSNWEDGALYIDDCLICVNYDVEGDFSIKPGTRVIGDWAIDNRSLTSITIPNSVTSIGLGAFGSCSLTSITIPNSVTSIGYYAFNYTALYNNKSNWEDGALYIDDCLIGVNYDVEGDFSIKPGTRLIADFAFVGCSGITSITIPNSVKSIGAGAFFECSSLTSIAIPNSVTSIGKGALYKCSSLNSITIPSDLSMTDNYADSINRPIPPPPPPPAPVQDLVEEEQEEEQEEEVIFIVVETMPEFPGGAQAMMRFIGENTIYPTYAQEKGIQGRVICQFVVEKDGKVTDIKVVRSSGDESLDKEAVRLINSMPKWKPGKQRGKPVRVKYTIPVNFRLQ